MGLPPAGRMLPKGMFGPSTGPVWVQNPDCYGNEPRLDDCRRTYKDVLIWGLNPYNCTPNDVANIECGVDPPASE